MSPRDQKQSLKESWRTEIHNHFASIRLSTKRKQELTSLLSQYPLTESQNLSHPCVQPLISERHAFSLSHFVTALVSSLVTACFVLLILSPSPLKTDIFLDLAQLPDIRAMPADFDLVGDATALSELAAHSLTGHSSFHPVIPEVISQSYQANEGRFFQFQGLQGVGITIQPLSESQQNITSSEQQESTIAFSPTTLYILKLPQKGSLAFPEKKIVRKIRSPFGAPKKVWAWREGSYGYAMIQAPDREKKEYF